MGQASAVKAFLGSSFVGSISSLARNTRRLWLAVWLICRQLFKISIMRQKRPQIKTIPPMPPAVAEDRLTASLSPSQVPSSAIHPSLYSAPSTSPSLASFASPSSDIVSPSSDGAGPTRSYLDAQLSCGTLYSADPSSTSGGQTQSAFDAQVELPSGASSPIDLFVPSPSAVNSSKPFTCLQSSSVTKITESQPSLPDAPAGRWRVPIHTGFIKRYERKYKIPKQNTLSVIPPMTTHFPHLTDGECGNWVRVTHPEGGLYFYDAERHIFTDAYVYEPTVAEEVEQFVLHINEIVKLQSKLLPSNHELVLEIEPSAWDTGETLWGYYYIDHDTRSQFWLEEFDNSYLTWELSGVTSFSHIKHEIECQYWRHWSLFPIGPRQFPEEICEELLGILTHNAIDTLTSPTSTTPYDVEKLLRTISLVKNCSVGGPGHGYLACGLSRVMGDFCHSRYIHYHGQRGARLDRNKSVHDDRQQRTPLIRLLSPVLFWAPESHLFDMEQLWIDDIVNHSKWDTFVSKLQKEWTEFVAYASILLTANVAFLAIPAVTPQDGSPARSPAQIASDMSVVFSVGSIILGLLLIRQHRSKALAHAREAADFLLDHSKCKMGLEPLAIIQSLPYALLIWAMVTYFVAFSIFCFWETNIATRLSVGLISSAVLSSILWCIVTVWNTSEDTSWLWFVGLTQSMRRHLGELCFLNGDRIRVSMREIA